MRKIEDLLKYEQPTKYIVSSTDYNDEYSIPVLTPGQSFILGYTDETENIFDASKEPVVIFDDFTTSIKYVDFPFKVKSSAMKILHATELCNIKYAYYLLKSLKIDTRTHKRYWISTVSQIEIPELDLNSQKKIADIFEKLDQAIDNRKKQLEDLKLMIDCKFNEMFGNPIDNKKDYPVMTFKDVCKVRQGLQIPISQRKKEPGENRYKYITIQYLHGAKEEEYIENPKENVICKSEDILMTRTGNTGMVITDVSGVFHNNFFLIDYDKNLLERKYLLNYLNLDIIQEELIRRATTSTIPDLSHGEFYKIKIIVPDKNKQIEFSNFVTTIEKQIEIIKSDISDLEEIMKAKMQEIFK